MDKTNLKANGLSIHPTYTLWRSIKKKGQLCEEWTKYINFHNWSIANGWEENKKLYILGDICSPDSCKWGEKLSSHPLYKIWTSSVRMCYDPKNSNYSKYGAKNISMCEEWKDYFYNFYEWCINNGWNNQTRIDRKDKSGNFEPENIIFSNKKKSNTKPYNIFNGMKQRCYNEIHISYKDYGGRGITICDEWLNSPQLFYDWTIDKYKEGLEIDRKITIKDIRQIIVTL